MDNYLYLDYVGNVSGMTFERDGNSYNFVFNTNAEKLDITSAYLNGTVVDTQTCRLLYQTMLQCHIRGEQEYESTAEPELKLTIDNVTGVQTVFEFRRMSSAKVHVTVNGGGDYYINFSNFETLLEKFDIVVKGGKLE